MTVHLLNICLGPVLRLVGQELNGQHTGVLDQYFGYLAMGGLDAQFVANIEDAIGLEELC